MALVTTRIEPDAETCHMICKALDLDPTKLVKLTIILDSGKVPEIRAVCQHDSVANALILAPTEEKA